MIAEEIINKICIATLFFAIIAMPIILAWGATDYEPKQSKLNSNC
jgi:hypothetical protein